MDNITRNDKDSVFSIIIPCKTVDSKVKRCIYHCSKLLNRVEIIVVPDDACPGLPSAKRNWAMERAKGKYFAFIDSDAYPTPNWLSNAYVALQRFPAVCGPGILPKDATPLEKAADLVFKWLPYSYRVTPKEARIVSEFPTFNLIVRREVATEFPPYLTGEDSLFCRKIEGGIYYHPLIVVYHDRRPLFKPFWKQVSTYGLHRGHLIRLALLGWLSVPFVYGCNFIRGFFRSKL